MIADVDPTAWTVVVFIDINGPGCALVKVQVQAPSGRYSDYLCMLKFREGWRIVAKVFAPYDEGH